MTLTVFIFVGVPSCGVTTGVVDLCCVGSPWVLLFWQQFV